MTSPAELRETTTLEVPSSSHAVPEGGTTVPPRLSTRARRTAQLRWLGINALCGAAMGLLIHKGDALVRAGVRLLM